MLPNEDTPT